MKKITLLLTIISALTLQAQYSTGDVTLSSTAGLEMSVNVDIQSTEVTLTLKGPSDRWFAIGFGGVWMATVSDVFAYDGTGNYDKIGQNQAAPVTDANQDWTLVSNSVAGTQRTLVATRPLTTADADDYTFTNSTAAIPVIWARGNTASNTFAYHGERGITTLSPTSTASVNEYQAINFAMYPNPTNSELNIVLPSNITIAKIEIYDTLGKVAFSKNINEVFNNLDVSTLHTGLYLIKVITDDNTYGVKQFIKK